MSGTITAGSLTSLSGAGLNITGKTGLNASATAGSILISANAEAGPGSGILSLYGCGSVHMDSSQGPIYLSAHTGLWANGSSSAELNSAAGPVTVNGYSLTTLTSYTDNVLISANAVGKSTSIYGCASLTLGTSTADISIVAATSAELISKIGTLTVNGQGLVTIESNANNVIIAANAIGKSTSIYGCGGIVVCSQSGSIDVYSGTYTNITSGTTFSVTAVGVNIDSGSLPGTFTSTSSDIIIGAAQTTYVNGTNQVSIESAAGGVNINAKNGMLYVNGSKALTIHAIGTGGDGDVNILANHQLNLTSNGRATLSIYDSGGSQQSLTFNNYGTAYGTGITISGVAAPDSDNDVANKQYVDSLVVGLNFQHSCRLNALSGASPYDTYPDVTYLAGVISVTGIQTIDGQALVPNDRILVTQNAITHIGAFAAGIYIYSISGSNSILTRDITDVELNSAYTYIEAGTSANKAYVQTYVIEHSDTDDENWILFSAVGFAGGSHIGPTTLGANGYSSDTGISTMASVRAITSGVSYIQNFAAGGLILESNVISQSTPVPRYGPAFYLSSPNCAGFGQKGVIRMVTQVSSDGSDIYTAPDSKLSFQRFGYVDSVSPVITAISLDLDTNIGRLIMTADPTGNLTASAMCDGVEVMFSAPNADTWIGNVLDPTKTYYVKNYNVNGVTGVATFQVSKTIGGNPMVFDSDDLTGADPHIHLWREISCFSS
jgi:hypothetical protein